MKKNFKYAILSAIAFVGAVSFSACQSSDEIVDNPNYDSEKKVVKTEFTISIPNVKSPTRMEVAPVQGQTEPVFVGMRAIKLLPYGVGTIEGSSALLGTDAISLDPLGTSDLTGLALETDGTTKNNAKVYSSVEVPENTMGFLVYGVGQASEPSTVDDKFANGVITTPSAWTGTPSTFTFGLESINDGVEVNKAKDIIQYLTAIAAAEGWKDEATTTTLGQLYQNFTSMKAGSSFSIQYAIQQLYNNVASATAGTALNIKNAITASYTPTGETTAKAFATAAGDGTLTFVSEISDYPNSINLPDGAVSLSWSSGTPKVPSYVAGNASIGGVATTSTDLTYYKYPASLYYRSNSSIKVSNVSEAEHYVNTNSWAQILAEYGGGNKVTKNTRSVVIETPLQYAVGRLDLTIEAGAAVLKDRNGEDVTVDATNGFPVSAVLIGGQNHVDFEFAKSGSEGWTIYDKTTRAAKYGTPSAVNYTLALESGASDKINVAVELTNNTGFAFRGVDGIIPPDGKFYLVAELDPSTDKTSEGDKVENSTAASHQVFKQDFITTVRLTISPNAADGHSKGLGAAYNVLPDLRSTKLELGMSVNLQWQEGLIFEKTI